MYQFSIHGNRTEWSPTRSVIIVSDKQNCERGARVQFVFTSSGYRPNLTTRSRIANLLQMVPINGSAVGLKPGSHW